MLFFEHKALYRRLDGERPDPGAPHAARARRASRAQGGDATVVTYGAGVDLALRGRRGTRRRGARPAHRLAARRRGRAASRSRRPRGCSCCRRRRARAGSPARSSRSSPARASSCSTRRPSLVAPPDTPVPFAPELEDAYLPSAEVVARSPRGAPWLLSPRPALRAAVDAADVAPETRVELFRLMLLQRLVEERIMALYRQGRIAGQRLHGPRPGGASPPARGSRSGPTTSSRR